MTLRWPCPWCCAATQWAKPTPSESTGYKSLKAVVGLDSLWSQDPKCYITCFITCNDRSYRLGLPALRTSLDPLAIDRPASPCTYMYEACQSMHIYARWPHSTHSLWRDGIAIMLQRCMQEKYVCKRSCRWPLTVEKVPEPTGIKADRHALHFQSCYYHL